jgi:hypothetical protein
VAPCSSPQPSKNHDPGSVTTSSSLEPTDWYMLPIRRLSGWSTGLCPQLTEVSEGVSLATGSSAASL